MKVLLMETTGVLQREKTVKMLKICKIYASNGLIFENMDIGLSVTKTHIITRQSKVLI